MTASDRVEAPLAEPRTRAAAVGERLRSMILSGELAPGTRLRQVEIAQRFNVSTTPVREAFTSLAREGLVRQDAHRGVEVFRPSVPDIRENYEIRLALEPLAAELAAARIDDATLDELDRILDEMEKPIQFRLGTELNREFHFAIYQSANRPLLLEMIERLRHAADAYVLLLGAHATPSYPDAVRREHREIAAALRRRSPAQTRKAMTTHLRHSLDEIRKVVAAEE